MIAFYFPYSITQQSSKPSILRPTKMFHAFKKLNKYQSIIDLTGKKRNLNYNCALMDEKINYIYFESINKPLLIQCLLEKKLNFLQDYIFFWKCRKKKIPMAIFYRDAYWATEKFSGTVSFFLYLPLKTLFYLEFKFFDYVFDIIYLPSTEMAKILPLSNANTIIKALPPAIDYDKFLSSYKKKHKKLSLLYVGNISPIFYDISPIIKLVQSCDNIIFNLCCRKEDWDSYKNYYQIIQNEKFSIHHVNSEKLQHIYCNSDLHLMFFNPDSYRDFAVPYKFFESLQYKTPVISNNNTKVASLINELDVGWVFNDIVEIYKLVSELQNNHSLIDEKLDNIKLAINENTWDSRVNQVDQELKICAKSLDKNKKVI